jgi:hypothetical protein
VTFKRYLFGLLILISFVLIAGYLLLAFININASFSELAILTFCFSAIVLLILYVFHRGIKKEPEGQTMHLLAAISIKMLLEMALALLWFFVAKKTSVASLILFFVLYLAFSLFSITLMLNTLKNKSL